MIKITSRLVDNELRLTVRDTGVGMSEEEIEKVLSHDRSDPDEDRGGSFGLWGTIERIRFYCNKDDVVKIRSEQGEYTEIEFTIPGPRGR